MFLAYTNEPPNELQKLFEVNNVSYPMRNPLYSKKKKVKSSCKYNCMFIYGVESFKKDITFDKKM